jgi:hypothetical protein
MRHGAQVSQHSDRPGQMLEDMEHGDGIRRFVTAEALEVPLDELDSLPTERLAASFNGWPVDIHANLFQVLRQSRQKRSVVTSRIKDLAAGAKKAPRFQPVDLLGRMPHGRSVRTTRFRKKNAKAIFRIAGVQIEREAIEALDLADIGPLGKFSGVGVKLELIELKYRSRAMTTADRTRTLFGGGSRTGIAGE